MSTSSRRPRAGASLPSRAASLRSRETSKSETAAWRYPIPTWTLPSLRIVSPSNCPGEQGPMGHCSRLPAAQRKGLPRKTGPPCLSWDTPAWYNSPPNTHMVKQKQSKNIKPQKTEPHWMAPLCLLKILSLKVPAHLQPPGGVPWGEHSPASGPTDHS